ncbi:MAG: DUF411 domain-containing protein [Steroidobacteraceae bacterium]
MNDYVKLCALAAVLGLGACAPDAQVAATAPAGHESPAASLPTLVVHKSQYCGCCELWVEHMRAAGFSVEVIDTENFDSIKSRLGVPAGMGACHTAEVDGYFVEGHVPASDVKKMLAERPPIRGLAVPGMPLGSPGMEQGDQVQPYDVIAVAGDGSGSVFARHGY